MGFFTLTGQRYQMVIPKNLNMDVVKRAAIKFLKQKMGRRPALRTATVTTLTYAEAKAWQARLRQMDENHRCADRLLLLELSVRPDREHDQEFGE